MVKKGCVLVFCFILIFKVMFKKSIIFLKKGVVYEDASLSGEEEEEEGQEAIAINSL